METVFTRTLGTRHPIVQAPMGTIAGPRLVAACANAGALGMLPIWLEAPPAAAASIAAVQLLTEQPIAVNVRADLVQLDLISAALGAGVELIHLFWGDPTPSMAPIRAANARMIATVSDRDTTKAALDAGAAVLIAQGVEAGGHVFGTTPRDELIRIVTAEAGEVPVVAAGGIVDADDVLHVLGLGAAAAALGTRLVATDESDAHPDYKRALIEAGSDATALTLCFDGMWPDAPHRTLKNSTYRTWEAAGRPPPGSRPGEADVVLRVGDELAVERYSAMPPTVATTGDSEAAALYAGTGVARIHDIRPAAEVIREVADRLAAR